jgi:hypothetical protein
MKTSGRCVDECLHSISKYEIEMTDIEIIQDKVLKLSMLQIDAYNRGWVTLANKYQIKIDELEALL